MILFSTEFEERSTVLLIDYSSRTRRVKYEIFRFCSCVSVTSYIFVDVQITTDNMRHFFELYPFRVFSSRNSKRNPFISFTLPLYTSSERNTDVFTTQYMCNISFCICPPRIYRLQSIVRASRFFPSSIEIYTQWIIIIFVLNPLVLILCELAHTPHSTTRHTTHKKQQKKNT